MFSDLEQLMMRGQRGRGSEKSRRFSGTQGAVSMIKRAGLALLVALLALLLVAPLTAAAAGSSHTVQPGENLTGIAATYGVSVAALQQANGLASPNRIYAGQILTIPEAGTASSGGAGYVVQPGDTLSGIAVRSGVSLAALAAANNLSLSYHVWIGQRLAIPGSAAAGPPAASGAGSYTVRPGDTLSGIAAQYGLSTDALAAANGITNLHLLFAGSVLQIPAASGGPAGAGGSGLSQSIDVNLSTEMLTAYEGSVPVFSTAVSTGIAGHPTVVGTFQIYEKLLADDMRGGRAAEAYYLPNVPYVMYFYPGGYAIHGTYWHHNFGHPMSHGCVNLSIPAARWMYNWAPLGTPVTIHW